MIIINRKCKGFTIVELAVSLIIIGIIVLIALGAYKGVRGTMVHVQWQATMDDAYNTLVRYAYDEGYFPKDQAGFDKIFTKKVDDYSFGGTVIYENVAPSVSDETFSLSKKRICSLTNQDISNPDHIVFTLKEKSRSFRPGKLDDRNVTLADVQASLKCLPATTLSISDTALPMSRPDRDYTTSVYAFGGALFPDGTYEWCVEVAPSKDLKCAATNNTKPVNLVKFFNDLQDFVIASGGSSVPFSTNCAGTSGWIKGKQFNLVFKRGDKRRYLGADSIPFKLYVRDASGTMYSRNFDFVNFGLYVHEFTGNACNFE